MSNSTRFKSLFDMGFSVFPVAARSKKPAGKWEKYQTDRPGVEEVTRWDASNMNVGVVCGRVSNLFIIDIDNAEGQKFYDSFGAPLTPSVRTAKGRHYYYRYPTCEVRNRVKVNDVGFDVRAEGGYVVGPGSVHETGVRYEWEISPSDVPFADLPANLLDAISATSRVVVATPSGPAAVQQENRYSAWALNILNHGLKLINVAEEGTRNDTLNRVGFGIASFVAAAELDWLPYANALSAAALAVGLDDDEVVRTLQSAWEAGRKKPCPWVCTGQRYVFLTCRDQFWDVQEQIGVKASAINKTHNSELAGEKGPIASFLTNNDLVDKAFDLKFDPLRPEGVYVDNSRRWLNTYVAPGIVPVAGDAAPFVDFVTHLVPVEKEREHLLKMIAWTVRNPGKKLGHALLLRSEQQGVGKSMLVGIWRELLGVRNTRLTTTEEITGNYQTFIEGNLLILVEELNVAFGTTAYNRVKNLISGETAEINEKFVTSRERPNHATFVFLTNLSEPILIEDSDRRFFYVDSPAIPRDASYYAGFAEWWKGNIGVILAYLENIDLSDFNRFAHPPETEAKRSLQLASRSPLEQELIDAREERRWPFSRDILTLEEVRDSIQLAYSSPPQRLKSAMRAMGAVPLGQHRMSRPNAAGSKPSLWAVANTEYWSAADPQDRVEEFNRRQGLLAEFDGLPIGVGHARSNPHLLSELSRRLGV